MNILALVAMIVVLITALITFCRDEGKYFIAGLLLALSLFLADMYKCEYTGDFKTRRHAIYYVDDIPVINSKIRGLSEIQKWFKVPLKETDVIIEEYKVFFDGTHSNPTYRISRF